MMNCDAEKRKNTKINEHVSRYIELIESGEIMACKDQQLLVAYVRRIFETESIYVDEPQLEKYLGMVKYFPFEQLYPWEEFLLTLHCCTYREDGLPRWPDLFMLIGRGAGKDGYIGFESACLMGPYNGIKGYNVDICANSELQAKEPFDDFYKVLDDSQNRKKLIKFFYWNKEEIRCLKTGAKMKYRTNNPKGKDGLRSGIVWFNEIHQYQNYDNINVFTTGLGKKPHPRRGYATTNGDVRDGPLDHYLDRSTAILEGEMEDNGWLPFICRLDDKKEVDNPDLWAKANPSLPYRRELREEMLKEYADWKMAPSQFTAFMTKRMNIPDTNREIQVTTWENIQAACAPIVAPERKMAVVGIDYASLGDMAATGILYRIGDIRYWITHSWLCSQSPDIPRLKIPWKEWANEGHLTVVDDVEIRPELLTDWIADVGSQFYIPKLALDNFRYNLMMSALKTIGFDAKNYKNIKLVRLSDQMIVSPVIESCFNNHLFAWGDNPLMRWATNNVKMIRTGFNRDLGNMTYGKIEPKSRKTDPFMALAAAMTIENELAPGVAAEGDIDLGIWKY